jgi:predicted MFS family arabinose efflux permease
VWGTVVAVAVAVGPLLGGVLTTDLSWRWIFFVNVPIGVVGLAVTVARVVESRQPGAHRPDWLGFGLFTASLVALVYGLIRASLTSWTDFGVLLCFGLAFGLAVAFVVAERAGQSPMFDLTLFSVPTFDGGLLASFCISASVYSLLLYIVLYLQDGLGYSALGAGVRMLVISGGTFVTSALAARLTQKIPVRWLIAPGLVVAGIGVLLLARLSATSGWGVLVPGFLLAGLGNGIVNPPLASTAVGVVEPHRAGMASGINNTFRQIGIATGIAALGSIFATREAHDLATALHRVPALAPATGTIEQAVRNGTTVGSTGAGVPSALRPALQHAVQASFVRGLDDIFVIAAVVAFVGAIGSLALIRDRDFVAGSHLDEGASDRATLEIV